MNIANLIRSAVQFNRGNQQRTGSH